MKSDEDSSEGVEGRLKEGRRRVAEKALRVKALRALKQQAGKLCGTNAALCKCTTIVNQFLKVISV